MRQETQQLEGASGRSQWVKIWKLICSEGKKSIEEYVFVTNLDMLKLLRGFKSQTHSLTQVSITVLLRQRLYLKTHTTHTYTQTHPHSGQYMVSQFNHIQCVFCVAQFVWSAVCATIQQRKEQCWMQKQGCPVVCTKQTLQLFKLKSDEGMWMQQRLDNNSYCCLSAWPLIQRQPDKMLFCLSDGPSSI